MKRLITLVTLSLFAAGAHAAGEFSHLDITFLQSDLDAAGADTDGDGIGVEFNGGFIGKTFFAIEHSARNYDDPQGSSQDFDLKLTEFGLGYKILEDEGAFAPYVGINLFNAQPAAGSDEGLSGVIGLRYALNDRIGLGARYKILKSDDSDAEDGNGFRVTGSFALTPVFGFVARYEALTLEPAGSPEFDVTEFSVGFRAIFGGGDE